MAGDVWDQIKVLQVSTTASDSYGMRDRLSYNSFHLCNRSLFLLPFSAFTGVVLQGCSVTRKHVRCVSAIKNGCQIPSGTLPRPPCSDCGRGPIRTIMLPPSTPEPASQELPDIRTNTSRFRSCPWCLSNLISSSLRPVFPMDQDMLEKSIRKRKQRDVDMLDMPSIEVDVMDNEILDIEGDRVLHQ